jgi:hypothetical protein
MTRPSMRRRPSAFSASIHDARSLAPRPSIDGSPDPVTITSPAIVPFTIGAEARTTVSNLKSQPAASAAPASANSFAVDAGTRSVRGLISTSRSLRSSEWTTTPHAAR